MKTKKQKNHYSEEFKWRVVQEVLSGRFTKEEARKVYGIKSNCAILYWMRQFSGIDDYRAGGESLLEKATVTEMKKLNKSEQRIQELEEELNRERVRADLWQKMVELAEDQLDIDIKKSLEPSRLLHQRARREKNKHNNSL